MKHKKLLNFFAAAVVLCLALTGQAFAADASQNIATRAAGVSVRGRVTSYLPGVSCTVQLRQGDAVRYSMPSFPGVGTGKGTQEFIIPGVADGVYDLVITKPGHLNYTIRNIVVQGSDVDLTTNDNDLVSDITLVAGDFNGDGCVDLRDLVIITSSENFGKSPVVTVFDNGAADNPEALTGLDDFYYETTSTGIRITGVSVRGRVTSYLPGVGCPVQLRQGDAVRYFMPIFPGVGTGKGTQEFIIPGVADGVYDLVITKPGHLNYTIRNIVVQGSDVDLTTNDNDLVSDITLVAGDFNGDGCVDLRDLVIITSSENFGKSPVVTVFDSGAADNPEDLTGLDDFYYEITSTGIRITGVKDKTKTAYVIPDSVTGIGESAFEGCTSLTSVSIGNGVTSIGSYAFEGCTSLTSVYITDIAAWCKISFEFLSNGFLSNPLYNGGNLYLNGVLVTNLVIPDSVTSIGNYAFYGCSSLTSVTIPDGVTSIGDAAFVDCTSLTSVTIPDSVTFIKYGAFRNCSSLTSVTIPDSVTSIGGSAFSYCSNLTSVTIGNSVTSIGNSAFYNCSSLTSVTIGNSVTNIGNSEFYNCSSLTSVVIPDSVTSIGNFAFYGCSSLTSITIPDSVTSIGGGAFSFCSGLTSVTIPDRVTSIGDDAFSCCSGLTSITIPKSVTSIGDDAFSYCSGLTSITIPDGVTSIGEGAFTDCSSLTSVTIPDSVTSIGNYTFFYCNSLTNVTIPNSVTSIGEYAFYGCSSLTSVTIPDSVTSIGTGAFSECTSLTSVSIGNGVTSIGDSAFRGWTSLTSVTIGNSVTSIGNYAFYGCELTSVTIPDSVTSIGKEAFSGCSSLTSIKYRGTEAQWEDIDKGSFWKYGAGAFTVTYNYTGE